MAFIIAVYDRNFIPVNILIAYSTKFYNFSTPSTSAKRNTHTYSSKNVLIFPIESKRGY